MLFQWHALYAAELTSQLESFRQSPTVQETTTSYGEVSVTYYQLDTPNRVYSISSGFSSSRNNLQMLSNSEGRGNNKKISLQVYYKLFETYVTLAMQNV